MVRIIIQIVMAIALIVFLFFQYRSVKKKRGLRKYFALVIFSFFALMLLKLIPFLIIDISSHTPHQTFSTEKWLKLKNRRTAFIDDLVARKRLDNKSEMEILDLLGEPSSEHAYFKITPGKMIYHLGKDHGLFRTHSKWLLIWFEKDRVSRYEIIKK